MTPAPSRPIPSAPLALALALLALAAAPGCSPHVGRAADGGPGDDGAALPDDDGGAVPDEDAGGGGGPCDNPLNLAGCGCPTVGETRACYSGPGATRGLGVCHDGTQSCLPLGEFAAWGPCAGEALPGAEVCGDGQDRNCNGKTGCDDPECAGQLGCCAPGTTRPCWSGPVGSDGVGPCHGGTQICDPQGAWPAACDGEALPGVEAGACHDGVDNDCNGQVDCKDPACIQDPGCRPKDCQPGATRPCYSGPAGTAGVGQCKPGVQTCDANGLWTGGCAGEVTPGSEIFHCTDGIDNDCNGFKDCLELFCLFDPACQPMLCQPGATQPCYDGAAGTQGVGPCHGGTQACAQDGRSWGPCTGQVIPVAEGGHCSDGVDNDCNGLVDCRDAACSAAPACCVPAMGQVDGTIYAHSTDTLYRLDPANWTLATVGGFGVGDEMTDLAVTPNGTLYAISFTALYRVDQNSGRATFVANLNGSGNNSLTFLPGNQLLAADSSGDLKRVDPATGQVTAIGNFGQSLSAAGDLVAVSDGTLYGVSSTTAGGGDASASNVLLRVDQATGRAVAVGPIGHGGVWGLAYANARLIGFTNTGLVLQIDPQTGRGTQIASKGINFWGAGMSPLVPANQCP